MTNDALSEYITARDAKMKEIRSELDRVYGRIAGHRASEIVDIWYELDRRGVVGIRMDNNFGVVDGNDAVKFANALAYAAELAADFEYLGEVFK